MLLWLRRLLSGPIRASDALFGEMRYMQGYWEALGRFPPTGTNVEYFVSGDASGPFPGHRNAFEEIVQRFPAILPPVREALQQSAERHRHDGPEVAALEVSGIEVPERLAPEIPWELLFQSPAGLFAAVAMRGERPSGQVEWSR